MLVAGCISRASWRRFLFRLAFQVHFQVARFYGSARGQSLHLWLHLNANALMWIQQMDASLLLQWTTHIDNTSLYLTA